MKKPTIALLLLTFLFSFVIKVSAEEPNIIIKKPSINLTKTNLAPQTLVTIKPIKLTLKKTNALKELDRRIASLTKIKAKIESTKRINADQKSSLIGDIENEIQSLQELRLKIDQEQDYNNLVSLKKQIVSSHRIYALYVPRIEIIAHAEALHNLIVKIQTQTQDEQMRQTLEKAEIKTQEAISLVINLKPDDSDSNKTTLKTARNLLREVRITLGSVLDSISNAQPK